MKRVFDLGIGSGGVSCPEEMELDHSVKVLEWAKDRVVAEEWEEEKVRERDRVEIVCARVVARRLPISREIPVPR